MQDRAFFRIPSWYAQTKRSKVLSGVPRVWFRAIWILMVAFSTLTCFGQEVVKKASVIAGKTTELTLPGFLLLKVPSGALPAGQMVQVSKTQSKETAEDFETSVAIYPKSVRRVPYEFRVNTGKVMPTRALEVVAEVPKELKKHFSGQAAYGAFVQFLYDSENESYDHFESVVSQFDANSGTIRFDLKPAAFTNQRNANQAYEAIVIISGQSLESVKEK